MFLKKNRPHGKNAKCKKKLKHFIVILCEYAVRLLSNENENEKDFGVYCTWHLKQRWFQK